MNRRNALMVLAVWSLNGLSIAEDLPFLTPPADNDAFSRLEALETKDILKEAEALQRKAGLVKEMADKKYVEAQRLLSQAGAQRAQASASAQAIVSRAQANQGTSELLGSLFGMISAASPMPTPNQSMTMGLTSKLFAANQAMDAQGASDAQTAAGQMEMQAEKTAGPLEMRGQALQDEGNRLMAAYNRLQSLANAKFLLAASEELRQSILEDRRTLAAAQKRLP